MNNAFLWKPSVAPLHQRLGHWNGFWRYWSTDGMSLLTPHHGCNTDYRLYLEHLEQHLRQQQKSLCKVSGAAGLGIYEYMLLAEALNAEPIWVRPAALPLNAH